MPRMTIGRRDVRILFGDRTSIVGRRRFGVGCRLAVVTVARTNRLKTRGWCGCFIGWSARRLSGNDNRVTLLAVSDLHYSLPQFEWLVLRAADCDVIVIAGDLLDLGSPVELDVQIIVISKYLDRIRAETCVVVCSGNHDGDVEVSGGDFSAKWLLDLRGKNLVTDGETYWLGPDKVTVCPWWESEKSKAKMAAMLRAEARRREKWRRWLWVHHAPPVGCGVSWTGKDDAGDAFVRELIDELRPDLVFSGHIHNAPFYADGSWVSRMGGSWVFNPGCQIGAVPAAVYFDSETMTADYRSLEFADRIVLD